MNRFSKYSFWYVFRFRRWRNKFCRQTPFPGGADIGAQIDSACTDLPAAGGTIQVYIPAGRTGISLRQWLLIRASKPRKNRMSKQQWTPLL